MSFVEFIEAIGRVADEANVMQPKIDMETLTFEDDIVMNPSQDPPLAERLENVVPLLFKICTQEFKDAYSFAKTSPYAAIQSKKLKVGKDGVEVPVPTAAQTKNKPVTS
jgi:hypothetical protein